MLGYTQVNKAELQIVNKYIKGKEVCKLSGEIELYGKVYRQILFLKKSFLYNRLETKGYLYFDEANDVLEKDNIIKEINKLGYYYEVFFHENSGISILDALKSSGAMQRSHSEFEKVMGGLDLLIEQNVAGAEKVKNTANRIPELREKSNREIQEFSDKIEEMKQLNLNFDEEQLNKLYPYYEKVLKANFETVKHLASLKDCCDFVIKECDKRKRKISIKIKSKKFDMLMKVSDELSYYRRLLKIYNNVLDMTSSQYITYLRKLNEQRIEERLNMIRSK